MRRPALVMLAALCFPFVAPAQGGHAEDDEAAIRRVAQLYISLTLANLREAFYPAANLYVANEQGGLRIIPLTEFLENVAKGVTSGEARPKMSIDLIDHVGDAAIVKIIEHSDQATVTDYLSLIRGGNGWKVVSKTFNVERKLPASTAATPGSTVEQVQAQNTCAAGEMRTFDFMAGDWITSESPVAAPGPAIGTSRTERILDDCAIWEHRYVEQNGKELFDAHVVLGYDAATKRMLLFYVDDRSHTQLYEGHRENGTWTFYRERPGDGGQTVLIRVIYAPRGRGFTQMVERSKDHGATWEPGSVVSYEPKH
jgi:hypothetical protein